MPYGFADDAWERAKQQAREVLGDVTRREATIPYSDLVTRIEAVAIEPGSYAMRAFLNEISTAEYDQGRGLLTAVVVYRSGDQMPVPASLNSRDRWTSGSTTTPCSGSRSYGESIERGRRAGG
jgi:hypothetical protein